MGLWRKSQARQPEPDVFGLGYLSSDKANSAIEQFKIRQSAESENIGADLETGSRWPDEIEIAAMGLREKRTQEYWARVRGKTGGYTAPLPQRSRDEVSFWGNVSEGPMITGLIVGSVALALTVSLGVNSYVDTTVGDYRAKQIVKGGGYKDVEQTGKSILFVGLMGCSKDDNVMYEFQVTDTGLNQSEVIVCAGLFKEPTIRVRR